MERPGPQLYDAVCSACKAPTQVPFRPDGKRPIYCKECKTKYLSREIPPISKSASAPFSRRMPSLREGEIAQKNISSERLSLEDLKKTRIPAAAKIKKEKVAPDLAGLREVLEKITEESKAPTPDASGRDVGKKNQNNGTLKPGDSIKF